MRTLALMGLLFTMLVSLVGCGEPEVRVIDAFLQAVKDGNEVIIEGVSLVEPPDSDIQSWEIVEIGTASSEPYRLAELRDELFDAKQALEAKIDENDQFLREHEKIAIRYQQKKKEDPDYEWTRGALAEFQEEWEAREAERKELQEKVKQAEEALERERESIRMSANVPLKDTYEGDVAVKDVKVDVEHASGPKSYTLTLRKYNLTDSETGITPTSKWIVAGIES